MAFLTTKHYVPPVRPDLVSRPRLVERLNAGMDGKLTLVSAPAGYGKTTFSCTSAFSGDDRHIVDYLVDEVLAHRPRGTKRFLLQTSILERMSGTS